MKTCFPKSLKTGEKICFKTIDQAVFDVNGVPLSDRLIAIKKSITDNSSMDSVLRARVDNLVAESTENTVNNAELLDIRTGYNDIVYTSAGSAVREQITDVYNAIKEITKYTKNAAPEETNMYDIIYTSDDKSHIYTEYVSFPHACSVFAPEGYKVSVILYSYNTSTSNYDEIYSTGWVDKYPIPKNTPLVIELKRDDNVAISKTEIVVLSFTDEYPETLKNSSLDTIGFYDSLQYKAYERDGFESTVLSTDEILVSNKFMFLQAKPGYQCKVVHYTTPREGEVQSVFHEYEWNSECFIASNESFKFVFSRIDGETITFDEFIDNFTFDEIETDNLYLNNLLNSMTAIGLRTGPDGQYQYYDIKTRLSSPVMVYDEPITLYIEDYNNTTMIAYHVPDDDDGVYYDSGWNKVITIPAKLPVVIYFKDDHDPVNARNLYNIKVKSTTDIEGNAFIKDIAHRGLSRFAPENTLQAYKFAKLQGFKYVECDVRFTSDGRAVLLHDETIDRTARDSSGNVKTGRIADLTFDTVRQYDFGYWLEKVPTGILIPSFDEFITFCKRNGLHPYIHIEVDTTISGNITHIQGLVDTVAYCGMLKNVTWISYSETILNIIRAKHNAARLGFLPSNTINSATIDVIDRLKNNHNGEVFIDAAYGSVLTDGLNLCINNQIPLEIWTVDDIGTVMNIPTYVSGVTSNVLQAGKLLIQE